MEISLSLDECKKISNTSEYKYIPIYSEILSDELTPISVLRKLKRKSKRCFLLESAEHDLHFGRWSILGFEPKLEVLLKNFEFVIKGVRCDSKKFSKTIKTDNPNKEINNLINENKTYKISDIPFTGGLVGCFSYDYYRYSEPLLQNVELEEGDFYDADLLLFDKVVLFDHYKQKVVFLVLIPTDDIDRSYQKGVKELKRIEKIIIGKRSAKFAKFELLESMKFKFDNSRYNSMVEKAKKHIFEGDIFQVVLSNIQKAKAKGSLMNLYRNLRTSNPSPYMFYFTSPYTELAGCSPETLVSVKNNIAKTYPLAGSRPRGKDECDDKRIEKELLSDEKELSEHNMLVDLGRNDLGKIAEIGSVKVTKYMNIEKYSHIMHIASEVECKIKDEYSAIDVLSSILPAGTLSGAPKIKACQIIDDLEGIKRGIYGGAVGYIDFTGNMDTCIAIRLAYIKNGYVVVRSGGGIVADSQPEKEIEELTNKAKAVVNALYKASGR